MYNQATQQLLEMEELGNSFKHKLKRIQKQEDFRHTNSHRFDGLTKREVEITMLVANDFNNPKIAEMLSALHVLFLHVPCKFCWALFTR